MRRSWGGGRPGRSGAGRPGARSTHPAGTRVADPAESGVPVEMDVDRDRRAGRTGGSVESRRTGSRSVLARPLVDETRRHRRTSDEGRRRRRRRPAMRRAPGRDVGRDDRAGEAAAGRVGHDRVAVDADEEAEIGLVEQPRRCRRRVEDAASGRRTRRRTGSRAGRRRGPRRIRSRRSGRSARRARSGRGCAPWPRCRRPAGARSRGRPASRDRRASRR